MFRSIFAGFLLSISMIYYPHEVCGYHVSGLSVPADHPYESDERYVVSKRNTSMWGKRQIIGCPESFTHLPESNKCYRLETDRLEWEVARLRCKGLHPLAHSVVINDAKENRAIATFIAQNIESVRRHCYSGEWMQIWTAGQRTDLTQKSSFVWKPDNVNWTEMKYTSWHEGQPDFAQNIEFCLHLLSSTDDVLTWNDAPCTQFDFAFMCVLCEIDMNE